MDRPGVFLDQMPDLHLVPGVELYHHFSFPSGHTATAFTILLLTGLITKKRWVSFILVWLACIAGFSRVYLSQHFLEDVLAGSLIGLFSALFFYWYFQGMNRHWLDKSILHIR
jgi:membrane-associated phospholipid phosphatase